MPDAREYEEWLERAESHADDLARRVADLQQEQAELHAAARLVIEAFDLGIFVRDTSHDGEPGWAIRLLPYVTALGRLKNAVRETEGT